MDLDSYQREALKTDQVPMVSDPAAGAAGLIVPLLGLAGETGQLLSEYKKHLRDGPAYLLFKERVAEELGDLLWYVSNVASKYNLSLGDIARSNLEKVQGRWGSHSSAAHVFDENFPDRERLPRRFEVELAEEIVVEPIAVGIVGVVRQVSADLLIIE